MTSEHHECRVTVDGAAPALVLLLRDAARIATEHGREWVTTQDVFAALIADEQAPLWWPRVGKPRLTADEPVNVVRADLEGDTVPLPYNEFRSLVAEWNSDSPTIGEPATPATVSYEISGPTAAKLIAAIEQS
ncbi:hypothetical protein HLB23_31570 [Nocardia uniformis]|uniref:Uncharacterized protein n=1 Tax=Nocardia uniformis TaxID=53432 RepID=A0A849C9D9_9NOCA|nr:hypothetical protein [Nocardia uniformis]NNH74338.1 hypothetical protein [Nocardia uniformis]